MMFFRKVRSGSAAHVRFFPVSEGEFDGALTKLAGSVCAWLPFVFLLFVLPTELYLSNALNFEYRFEILFPYFGFAILFLVLLLVLGKSPSTIVQKILDGLFFIGILAVVSFGVIPIQWSELNGHDELYESFGWGSAQLLVFLMVLLSWLHIPSTWFRKPGAIFVTVLFGSQLINMTQAFNASPQIEATVSPAIAIGSPNQALPNIYHVVFDAYSGRTFPAMADALSLDNEFRGFTYFPHAMAHYPSTDLSIPSYLTGSTYKTGSVREYQLKAKNGGLSEHLRLAGYQTSSYSPNRTRFWSHNTASQIYATSDEYQKQVEKTFMLVSAVRAAPEFLRQEIHGLMSSYLWNGENAYSHYRLLSVPLVEKFLEDEEQRSDQGHYNYVHLILPHGPYVRNGDCSISDQTSYLAQAECASRIMKLITDRLKTLGRYDSSIIVFQSDHGSAWRPDQSSAIESFPLDVDKAYAELGHTLESDEFLAILDALLIVKPGGAAAQGIKVSDLGVQLIDVPATVIDLAGLGQSYGEGHSVFSEYVEREVDVFVPTQSVSAVRAYSGIGKRRGKAGVFAHFTLSPTEGWITRPSIDIFHDG